MSSVGSAPRGGGTVRPSGTAGGGGQWGGWLIVGVAATALTASALFAVAGSVAAAMSGELVWQWDFSLPVDVVRDGPTAVWPTVSPVAFWAALGVLGVLAATGVVGSAVVVGRRFGGGGSARSLASAYQLRALARPTADVRARQLRLSLPAGGRFRAPRLADRDVGLPLGRLEPRGPALWASWEDVGVAVMAPRAGKTTALAVPMVLAAPGAVLVTSNKADVVVDTIGLRREAGTCWLFDPQQIAYGEQQMWWDPLRQVTTVDQARKLAAHFLQEVAAGHRDTDFWNNAGLGLLSSLILAAAVSRQTMAQVWEWLNDSADPTPAQQLTDHGHPAAAAGLRGRQGGAPETREGIYETARTAAQCLEADAIMRWITPRAGLVEFRPEAFPAGTDTVYLLSKEGAGAAQPLVAALADQVLHVGQRLAEATPTGRLDPPLVAVLDEAANVCKIRDLPKLYSHLGSRNIAAWTILQSYRQGQGVWGELGMDTLWGAATIKVIGSGIDDPKLAEDLSRLVGEHEITTVSRSRGRDSGSTSTSTRRQRIIGPEDVRALPRWRALLMATGCPVAMIRTQPWFDGSQAERIRDASDQERAALATRAAAPTR